MTVVRAENGTYVVVDAGVTLASGFETSAAAWRWIDRKEGAPISPAEKKSDWIAGKILGGSGAALPTPAKRKKHLRRRRA